jgi:hypothetical protein
VTLEIYSIVPIGAHIVGSQNRFPKGVCHLKMERMREKRSKNSKSVLYIINQSIYFKPLNYHMI